MQERLRAWKLQLEQDDSGSDGGAATQEHDYEVHSHTAPAVPGGSGGGFSWDGFKSAAGELQGQNSQLMNQVSRAEAEIVRLRSQVEHYRSLQETVASDSPADAKVIQLAKKIKTLAVAGNTRLPVSCPFLVSRAAVNAPVAAVEREKGRSARLEKELALAQQERLKAEAAAASYAKLSKHRAKPQPCSVDDGGAGDEDSSKSGASDARELALTSTKLSELRIAFDKLKIEATRMHKALVRVNPFLEVKICDDWAGSRVWRRRSNR